MEDRVWQLSHGRRLGCAVSSSGGRCIVPKRPRSEK